MEKIHENMHFLCFDVISNTRAQKHACFQVRFPFSAYFYPPLHHNQNGKGFYTGSTKPRCLGASR